VCLLNTCFYLSIYAESVAALFIPFIALSHLSSLSCCFFLFCFLLHFVIKPQQIMKCIGTCNINACILAMQVCTLLFFKQAIFAVTCSFHDNIIFILCLPHALIPFCFIEIKGWRMLFPCLLAHVGRVHISCQLNLLSCCIAGLTSALPCALYIGEFVHASIFPFPLACSHTLSLSLSHFSYSLLVIPICMCKRYRAETETSDSAGIERLTDQPAVGQAYAVRN